MRKIIVLLLLALVSVEAFAQTDTVLYSSDTSKVVQSPPIVFFSDSLYHIHPENPMEVCSPEEDVSELPVFVSTGDSLHLQRGDVVVFKDTIHCVYKDTVFFMPYGITYRLGKNSELKAHKLYQSLKSRTDKHWWSSLAYSSVIDFNEDNTLGQERTQEFKQAEKVYKPYDGKYIRSINIRKVDVLEGSVDDTTQTASTLLARLANKLHVNTRERIIRNHVMFQVGDIMYDYLVADNERLIRQLAYIQDCRIWVVPNLEDTALVDVWVITEDKFSFAVDGTVGGVGNYYGELVQTNLMGIGHEIGLGIKHLDETNPSNDYNTWYKARNIYGTFIDINAKYRNSYLGTELESSIGRGFVNQFTKYAFSTTVGFITNNEQAMQADSSIKAVKYSNNFQDTWFGKQIMLGGKEQRKSLFLVARFRRFDAVDRPYVKIDSNTSFHNYRLIIGGVTYRKQNFYKNNFIQRFGVTEDIPYGYFLQYNIGYEDKEFRPRAYNSAVIGLGFRIEKIGYLSLINEFGSYIKQDDLDQGEYKFKLNYIANIIKLGRYKLRNLFTYSYVVGISRIKGENVSIENQIHGLKGTGLDGSEISLFHYELVNFTPWNAYGFRVAIATYADMAFLHSDKNILAQSNVYSAFGMALRIRNESLAIKSIEISFAYFPNPTDIIGNWVTQFSTSAPNTPSLNLSTVPGIVSYDLR